MLDLGSLLLFLALLLLAALFVARPLLSAAEDEQDARLEDALALRQRILDALVELDADWELGKIPEDIYPAQRQQLLAEGAAALKALEAIPTNGDGEIEEDDLEAMIQAYKKKRNKRK